VDVPRPPRDDESFRQFFQAERSSMIGLARAMGTGRIPDPDQAALDGWQKFHKHWPDCNDPGGYLRQCVISAVIDQLREAQQAPTALMSLNDERVAALVPHQQLRHSAPAQGGDPWDPELTRALAALSDKLLAAVLLDNELNPGERPVAEIAQILGIKRVAAHARLKRAYSQLRRTLPVDYPERRRVQRRLRRQGTGGMEEGSAT
jgi:DNA-directed RNA polymerase specialized sigma24 family protein